MLAQLLDEVTGSVAWDFPLRKLVDAPHFSTRTMCPCRLVMCLSRRSAAALMRQTIDVLFGGICMYCMPDSSSIRT